MRVFAVLLIDSVRHAYTMCDVRWHCVGDVGYGRVQSKYTRQTRIVKVVDVDSYQH